MSLQYRVDGDGERVLVMSGSIGSTAEMWEPQLPALTNFRVIRVDHPGHGGSPVLDARSIDALAREVLSTLDELGAERFSFCGLSLGGAIGMRLALDAEHRLERLVLVATGMRIATPEFWQERAALVRTQGMEAISEAVVERWLTPGFDDVRRYRDMLLSTDREGYARCCEALRDWDVRGQLEDVGVSTLVVAGSEDPATPLPNLQAIAAEMPKAQLVVLEGARHLVNVDHAAAFNDALLAHLE